MGTCKTVWVVQQASARDTKKLAEKERKLLEKSVREKEIALRDDDNVFDVSYENQGENTTDVVSATDIKVGALANNTRCSILCLLRVHSFCSQGRNPITDYPYAEFSAEG